MEEEKPVHPKKTAAGTKKHKQEVYVQRDIKEYLGESALIIFSVLLALFLTEYINTQHEKSQTRDLLNNVKNELVKNKQAEEEQYIYHRDVLKRIDSALNSPALQQKILSNGEFHLKYLVPHGILYHDLSKVAWQVAQAHNITLKIDFKLVAKLTDIYDNQARIEKLEDSLAGVLFTYSSRDSRNIHETLILIRDNFKGSAFDRAPDLIKKYGDAIKMIDAGER
ncbi:hypothetical protein BH09BAC6_BH09BAC6_03290 [soil metagenome]|jgi:hypothetical protein